VHAVYPGAAARLIRLYRRSRSEDETLLELDVNAAPRSLSLNLDAI